MCANRCRISTGSTKRTPVYLKSFDKGAFTKSIPTTIRDEIEYVVKKTKDTDREQSLTFCSLDGKDKIYVSDYATGDLNSTAVMPCNPAYGTAHKIGDLHTHPTQDKTTIGITPSTADMVSTLLDSAALNIPQISCITSNDAGMIHCYQPKQSVINNYDKLAGYKSSQRHQEQGVTDVHPFMRANVASDFSHAWYDRKTFKRIKHPTPKGVVHDAFLNSRKLLKFQDIPDLDKGPFCDLIEALNYPAADGKVYEECRRALRVENFLGIKY